MRYISLLILPILFNCSGRSGGGGAIKDYCEKKASCSVGSDCEYSDEACDALRDEAEDSCAVSEEAFQRSIQSGGTLECDQCVEAHERWLVCMSEISTCTDFDKGETDDCDGEYQEYQNDCFANQVDQRCLRGDAGGEQSAGIESSDMDALSGDQAGEAAGESTSGEAAAGELNAGEVVAGEMTAGEMTAGTAVAGGATAGEEPAGGVAGDEVPAGEEPRDEAPAGEAPAGEMNMSSEANWGERCTGDDQCIAESTLCATNILGTNMGFCSRPCLRSSECADLREGWVCNTLGSCDDPNFTWCGPSLESLDVVGLVIDECPD